MIVAPHRHRPGHELADLTDFLAFCRENARRHGRPVLASVTLGVRHIDPLAVLLKMRLGGDSAHYRECPAEDTAVAALGAATSAVFTGENRFHDAQTWIHERFADACAAGDTARAFGGPHAFLTAEFDDDAPLTVVIPARMVARRDGEHTAVANLLVRADTDPAGEAARMLAAHARFAAFDYGREPDDTGGAAAPPDFTAGEPAYAERVRLILGHIGAGAYAKVVPARSESWRRAGGFDTAAALEHLRARHPAAHTFSFTDRDGAEWIGATPETLLRVAGDRMHTEALAGTGARARHAADDARLEAALIADDKVRREQRLVTEAIVERLDSLGLTPEFPRTPKILRLPHTRHLLTPLSAKLLPGIGALAVAGALHPTPAVAGSPRAAALAALRFTGETPRAHYAGVSGWIDARGDAHLVVNLRCARVLGDTATLFAGAGIVAGSDPVAEARETSLKLRTVAEALAGD